MTPLVHMRFCASFLSVLLCVLNELGYKQLTQNISLPWNHTLNEAIDNAIK